MYPFHIIQRKCFRNTGKRENRCEQHQQMT